MRGQLPGLAKRMRPTDQGRTLRGRLAAAAFPDHSRSRVSMTCATGRVPAARGHSLGPRSSSLRADWPGCWRRWDQGQRVRTPSQASASRSRAHVNTSASSRVGRARARKDRFLHQTTIWSHLKLLRGRRNRAHASTAEAQTHSQPALSGFRKGIGQHSYLNVKEVGHTGL